ncbi:LLM class flavin-dependent oxidoreductase [Nocardioides sp. CER19]|uniref:LLM class flavin-dependent oxidoreductase n=1 Tax=Nocardioides sp. CER19 TaxID=3038538 RepID=UPI00244D1799|nr:LLM class flavin-dependent oxidoreductase [Nocardioides sp. CER19]MDH2416118.1 LLM class flavin-dependent oxidoreductase [Nocardioides sp. CER19]
MKFAIFNVPFALDYAAGKEPLKDVIAWGVQTALWADQYGLDEVFFAEHYTLGVECSPAPDLMIAAAAQVTNRVKLGALGHLVPYHNPVALAHRMLFLDHMTGGRYLAGVAPGAYPSDAQLFDTGSSNPAMLAEGLDIIEAIFHKPGPWRFEGKYWNADMPAFDEHLAGPHLTPLQPGGPEKLMTGMQPQSPTLTEAGRRGYSPVSQAVHSDYVRMHWETYAASAIAAGHYPSRKNWRITRDWLVADTDAQARELALNGSLGTLAAYNLEIFRSIGIDALLAGPDGNPDDLTPEWLIDNFALVGSPETVARKIRELYESLGGFGTIICASHARNPDPETWRRSWELTGLKVAPLIADLVGD